MKEGMKELPVRLAIRSDGDFVYAYICGREDIGESLLIASLDLRLTGKQEIYEKWKELMKEILSLFIEETYGEVPELDEHPIGGKIQ